MKHVKKLLAIVGVMAIVVGGLIQVNAAETNNIEFRFNIKSSQGNTFSTARLRETTNTKCSWMVDFRNSTESSSGARCITRFWLEKDSFIGTQVSEDADILEGSGRKYYKSTKSGTDCYVKLGAENNNYNASTYQATGYWDEETAKILK